MNKIKMNRKKAILIITPFMVLAAALFAVLFKGNERQDIRPRATESYDVSFTLNPPDDFTVNAEKTLSVIINSGTYRLGSADLKITYDPSYLQYIQYQQGSGFNELVVTPYVSPEPSGNSTLYYTAVVLPGGTYQSGMVEAAKITFKALKSGTTSVSVTGREITKYDPSVTNHNLTSSILTQAYGIIAQATPTTAPSPAATAIPPTKTPTPQPSQAPTATRTPTPTGITTVTPAPSAVKSPTPTGSSCRARGISCTSNTECCSNSCLKNICR